MSLQFVLSSITYPNISGTGFQHIPAMSALRQQIENAIANLYNNSPNHAQSILINAASAGALNFVEGLSGTFQGNIPSTGQDVIGVDFTQIAGLRYFNSEGFFVSEIFDLSLIHEIIHTIPASDPLPPGQSPTNAQMSAGFDFDGDVVRIQNQIAEEMGYEDNIQRNYYTGLGSGLIRATT